MTTQALVIAAVMLLIGSVSVLVDSPEGRLLHGRLLVLDLQYSPVLSHRPAAMPARAPARRQLEPGLLAGAAIADARR